MHRARPRTDYTDKGRAIAGAGKRNNAALGCEVETGCQGQDRRLHGSLEPTYLIVERAVELDEDYLVRVLLLIKPGRHLLMAPVTNTRNDDKVSFESRQRELAILLL